MTGKAKFQVLVADLPISFLSFVAPELKTFFIWCRVFHSVILRSCQSFPGMVLLFEQQVVRILRLTTRFVVFFAEMDWALSDNGLK